MAFDTARAYRWVIRTIKADATLDTLLAGEGAYRGSLPRDLVLTLKPAIAVNIQSDGPPSLRWMIRGHSQWHDTPGIIHTKIVMQGDDDTALEPVADRLDVILDGQYAQEVVTGADNATVMHCHKRNQIPFEELVGDVRFQNLSIFWDVSTKTA